LNFELNYDALLCHTVILFSFTFCRLRRYWDCKNVWKHSSGC